jgi:hypothetical protein
MFGRRKKKAAKALERDRMKSAGNRAADVAVLAADRARQAGRAAAPVMRKGAQSAAERAAEILSDTADRLSTSDTAAAARGKLADSAEALADAVRPKPTHRIRKLLKIGVIAGAIYALIKSPLRGKLMAKFSGESEPEPELEPITLPAEPKRKSSPPVSSSNGDGAKTKKPEASGSATPPE